MTVEEQMSGMERTCLELGARVEKGAGRPLRFIASCTLAGGESAWEVQRKIELTAKKYPNVVCYYMDSQVTLIYEV